jgi:hypothetical protein
MSQIFNRSSHLIFRGVPIIIFLGIILTAGLAMVMPRSSWETQVGDIQNQEIPFSHKHHVGGLGLDCRFCHSSVDRSANAGMPSTHTCLTCHSQIWKKASLLKPLHDSAEQNSPLEWNRVYRLPHYVYFNHSIHVTKGIGCVTCHGQVDQMPMMVKTKAFFMRQCLECHTHPEKYLRPLNEIYNLNWPRPEDQIAQGQALLLQNHIPKYRLRDCNTCHR